MDMDPLDHNLETTRPQLLAEADTLAKVMKDKDQGDLKDLMGISDKLADLNVERYQSYKPGGTSNSSKVSLFAFTGDVYRSMAPKDFSDNQVAFAQKTVRTLSGLYGVLRPLDLIQPYRLEMGTSLETTHGKNLYDFWGGKVTDTLNDNLKDHQNKDVINLASNEYYKVLQPKKMHGPVVGIKFLEEKDGKARVIGLFAKRARGAMTKWVIENTIEDTHDLQAFNENDYAFVKDQSTETELVYSRKQP